jgi:hypothetical protein
MSQTQFRPPAPKVRKPDKGGLISGEPPAVEGGSGVALTEPLAALAVNQLAPTEVIPAAVAAQTVPLAPETSLAAVKPKPNIRGKLTVWQRHCAAGISSAGDWLFGPPLEGSANLYARIGVVLSGATKALQALFLSFALIGLLVLVAVLADSPGANWSVVLVAATHFWILGHGGSVALGGVTFHLLPLGFVILNLVLVRVFAKRALAVPALALAGSLTYALVTAGLARLVHETPLAVWAAAAGGLLVALVGFLSAQLTRMEFGNRLLLACPNWLRLSLRAATLTLGGTFALGLLVTLVWLVVGRAELVSATTTLGPSLIGGMVLVAASVAVLPNWVIWATGWLVGPGFSLGAETLYAPNAVFPGPLPAFPLAAALPPANWASAHAQLVVALPVLAGAAGVFFLWRHLGESRNWKALWAAGGCLTGFAGLGMWLAQWLAQGGIGEGRLATIGATPWLIAAVFSAEVAVGVALVLFAKWIWHRTPARKKQKAVPAESVAVELPEREFDLDNNQPERGTRSQSPPPSNTIAVTLPVEIAGAPQEDH